MAFELTAAGPFCGPVAPPAPPVAVAVGAGPPPPGAKSNPDSPRLERPPRLDRAMRGELPTLTLPTAEDAQVEGGGGRACHLSEGCEAALLLASGWRAAGGR